MRIKEVNPRRMRLRAPLIWSPPWGAHEPEAEIVWKVERLDRTPRAKTHPSSPAPAAKKLDQSVEPPPWGAHETPLRRAA